jgi:hypothetical protein
MRVSLLAIVAASILPLAPALASDGQPAPAPATEPGAAPSTAPAAPSMAERFAGRGEARIAFESQIRNFRVEQEDGDDILYIEASGNRWYRAPLNCAGSGNPRFAERLIPISRGGGFDRFSRVRLTGLFPDRFDRTECWLDSVVELTPVEAVELKLERPRTAAIAPADRPQQ